MLFKHKKGVNRSSTINSQSASKEKQPNSKSTSGPSATSNVSLGITGATVSAPVERGRSVTTIGGDASGSSVGVQGERPDSKACNKQENKPADDESGFVVKRLVTIDQQTIKEAKHRNQAALKSHEELFASASVSNYYSAAGNLPPPSAPRSTPVVGGTIVEEEEGPIGYGLSKFNTEMSSVTKQSRDLSLPRLNRPTTRGYDVYQRPTTTAYSARFPGIAPGTRNQATSPRPDSAQSNAGLPPYFVRSTLEDIERLPAIHPSVWASRGEKTVEYRGFVSAPPVSATPPCTAAARRSPSKLNATALRRPSAVKKVETKSYECWKCALRLEHSKCETTKYIRIGGGYRHSYWFVRELIEKAKEEEERQLALIRKEQRAIFSEKLAWRVGKDGTRERRIKTFVRTSSGRKIETYRYVSEDIYNEMVALNAAGSRASESAKRRLKQKLAMSMGLSEEDADLLDNWDVQSVGADNVAVDEDGNLLLDEDGEPIDAGDIEKINRVIERRRKKGGRGVASDDESERADSGLAFSDNEERERRRRRRGDVDSDGRDSDQYSADGRKRREGRRGSGVGSFDGSDRSAAGGKKGRQRRGGGARSDGSAYGSDEENTRKGKRGKGGGKGDDGDSDFSDDVTRGGKRGKGKGGKNKSRSGSHDSGVSGATKTKGKRKGKKKDGDGDDESNYSTNRHGKGKRKGKKGARGESGSESDDSRGGHGGRGRKGKGKKKGGRHDDESGSGSDDGGKRKSKKKGKKGRRGSGSDEDGSDYTDGPDGKRKSKKHQSKGKKGDEGSQSDESDGRGGGGRRRKGRRGGKHSDDGGDYSDDEYAGEGGRKDKKHRRRHRGGEHSDDDDYTSDEGRKRGDRRRRGRKGGRGDSRYSDDDSASDDGHGRRHRRRRDRHGRHRDGDDGSDRSDGSYASDDSRRRRHRRHRRGRRDKDGGSDYSDSGDDSEGGHGRRRHRRDKRHRRRGRRGSSYSDDGSESGSGDGEGRKRRHRRRHGSKSRRRRGRDGDDYSDDSRSLDSEMSGDSYDSRRRRRRRRKKDKRRHRRHSSDDYSDYSDDEDGGGRRRRRRHRRRSSSYSDESGTIDSGADAESRRGRRRRHRRHRRRSSSSGSDYSDDSRSRERRRRRRQRRRDRGSEYSSDDQSSRSRSRSRRRRRRRRRHGSASSRSYSDSDSRSGSRHRRHRRRRRHHSDSDDSSDRSRHRSRRHKGRRHRRRHSYSTSSSDYTSSDDSRHRRRRRHRRRHSDSEDDSDSSESYDRRRGRRKDKHKKGRRHRRYSTSTEESSAGDEKPSKRRDRHRRRRDRYSDSETDSDASSDYRRRRDKKKKRPPPRPPSSDSSSLSSEASSGRLARMSKKERKAYERRRDEKIERKEKRQEQREKYERYMAKQERKKERRKNREGRDSISSSSDDDSNWGDGRTAVKYDRGSRRKLMDKSRKTDGRDIGYDDPNDPWKKGSRKDRKKKDRARRGSGSEPYSSSSGDELDAFGKKKDKTKKKKGKTGGAGSSSEDSDAQSIYEDVFGEDGTVQRRRIKVTKKKDKAGKSRVYDDDELDAESEYDSVGSADLDKMIARQIYDEDGEVIRLTKDGRRIKDGKISKEVFDLDKHKQKKKKKEKDKKMLEKSYEEEYVEEFIDEEGNVVRVVKKRLKEKFTAPGKRPATPLTGTRRVQVLFLRGGVAMQSRLEKLLADCPLNDHDPRKLVPVDGDGAVDLDERDGMIDYLTHYRLVNPQNLESYGKAFLVEDDDENNIINMDQARVALDGIAAIQGINDKQIHYILKVLGIDETSMITFKMFAVIAALCGRLLDVMDEQTKQWMEINDLVDMERKIGLYRAMFYWNTTSDRSSNYIKATSLRIELIAGGLNRSQEDYVLEKMEPNMYREVSFIDYMAFIPLFLTTHESIIENPLDMSRNKLNDSKALEPQRDMVPLGRPMTQVGASTMTSVPIPYEFEKRPGSSLRKRIRLRTPQPKVPTPELNDDDSFPNSRSSFSPVPPKVKRFGDVRKAAGTGTRQRATVF